jgi:hypothetical protein
LSARQQRELASEHGVPVIVSRLDGTSLHNCFQRLGRIPPGCSPFKLVCSAHGGMQFVDRGGAREMADGFVDVLWRPRGDQRVPQDGNGVVHEDVRGDVPVVRAVQAARQDTQVRLLRERARLAGLRPRGRPGRRSDLPFARFFVRRAVIIRD